MDEFEDIYKKYYIKIHRFSYRLTGNADAAEELTQETLYKGFLHLDQFGGRSSIYTWLCQIAKNTWHTECKKQKRFMELQDNSETAGKYNLEADVIDRVMIDTMRREIFKLPEPYRSVITLHIYAELTFAEIAVQYEKTESWARVTFYRGKSMLAERMDK